LNLKLFFPNDLSHWVYSGTSTSLNCQNGQSLNWFVMKQPVSFSRDQIDLFRRIYSNNALSVIGPLTPSKIVSKSNDIAH
ncbi:MAG: carbonic anhydrase family protein, partial [Proteobacteria bacterium]|nr:carbonic anhydrase family protein [Pseudomonadota bacterium]